MCLSILRKRRGKASAHTHLLASVQESRLWEPGQLGCLQGGDLEDWGSGTEGKSTLQVLLYFGDAPPCECVNNAKIQLENSFCLHSKCSQPSWLCHRGQAPPAQPHLGLDVDGQQRIDEPHVVVQARFIDVPGGTVREDTRPRDGKAVVGHAQVLQGDHILGNLVVTVTGHITGVIIPNLQWCVRKRVPNTESFAICSPRTFDLKMTRHV